MRREWQKYVVSGALTLLIGLFVVSGSYARVQRGTPTALETRAAGHPASIHSGACDTLHPTPAYPLEDVRLPEAGVDAPVPIGRMPTRHEVETSMTTIEVRLEDVLASPTAVSVYQRAEPDDAPIACGEIVGVVRPHVRGLCPGGLMIQLRQMHGSGYTGMAWLQPRVDGLTTVTIFLSQGLAGGADGRSDRHDARTVVMDWWNCASRAVASESCIGSVGTRSRS